MNLAQKIRAFFGDPVLVASVLAMSLFGAAMIYSAGQLEVPDPAAENAWRQQLMWIGISMFVLFVVMHVPVRWLEWIALPAYLIGLGALAVTLVIGTGAGTAASMKGWINLGFIRIQPAQFANVATVLMLAKIMGSWREPPRTIWDLWKPIAVTAVPMLMVLAQPDLGTAMVFGGVLLATMFWAGTPMGIMFLLLCPVLGLAFAYVGAWIYSIYMIVLCAFLWLYRARPSEWVAVLAVNLVMGTIAWPLWNKLEPYQQARIIAFADPSFDPRGAGYQVLQSKVAIGSGGVWGQGFLDGPQKRLKFLPEQHTDFIYAVIGEELGLIGTSLVLVCYVVIAWRGLTITLNAPDRFGAFLALGITTMIVMQAFVNMSVVLGLMPTKGIPLPFVSAGGSSLLISLMAMGVLLNVSQHASARS
jgi:rod shape determining protein RodA